MNYCPECGLELKEKFRVCSYCGFTLSSISKTLEKNLGDLSQKDKKIQELEAKIKKVESTSGNNINFFLGKNTWQFGMIFFIIAAFFIFFFFIIFFVLRR
jgi:uncharacterized membrane protein YvbJ